MKCRFCGIKIPKKGMIAVQSENVLSLCCRICYAIHNEKKHYVASKWPKVIKDMEVKCKECKIVVDTISRELSQVLDSYCFYCFKKIFSKNT